MEITGFDERQALVSWAERVRDLVGQRDSHAAKAIDEATAQFLESRFLLTVLGKAKRGKSTLVNALLGRHDDLLAPIDKLPASNVITRFVWAEQPSTTVCYRSGDRVGTGPTEAISYERIRDYVTEEGNPRNAKGVELVEVCGPFPGLDRDLVLIDTPGAGSVHEYHDALLHAFIPQSDAIVFLVTAGMPLDQDELDLLRKVRAAEIEKILFAINQIDRATKEEVSEAVTHNAANLRKAMVPALKLHQISAKLAFQGDTDRSGLPPLLAEIRHLLADKKGQVMAARFVSRVAGAALPVAKGLATELATIHKSAADIETERQALANAKYREGANRQTLHRRFQARWDMAIDRFKDRVASTQDEIILALHEEIGATSLTGVTKLAHDLPTLTAREIEVRLQPFAEELESSLRKECAELQAEFPTVEIQQTGVVAIRCGTSHMMTKAAAGAAVSVAAGAGVIAAANAAAAASVAYVTTPSVIGTALAYFAGTSGPFLTSTAVPVAAPLWVAMAGPIGWTLGGIGALAIPFAWTVSKSKQKTQLEAECDKQVKRVLDFILNERVPALRRNAEVIVLDFETRLDRDIEQVEAALATAGSAKLSEAELAARIELARDLESVLTERVAGA